MPEFVDAYGLTIHYARWEAERPRAIVQIVHGVGEHSGRYAALAEDLVAAGYTVYADDHRGHGLTGREQHGGDLSRLGLLGPGGLRATEGAIVRFTRIIREAHPGLPLILIGHSWGSLMAQRILERHSRDYDAVVLSGSAYRVPGWMNGGDLAKRHRVAGGLGLEWLSRDPEVWSRFHDDPLTFEEPLVKKFGVLDAARLFGRPGRGARSGRPGRSGRSGQGARRDLPLLIMVGDDDPLGGGRSARRLADAYRDRSGLRDVALIVYPDARHEIFVETNRDEVVADLLRWMDDRIPESAGSGTS